MFDERDGEIVMYPPFDEVHLAEGYRNRASRPRELASELEETSTEVTENLGDAPEW